MLKAEVSPKTKILLSEMAKKDKRSLKKQVEYIIETEVRKQNSKPKHDIMMEDTQMVVKKTTKDLLGEYIDLEIQAEYSTDDSDITEVVSAMETVKQTIRKKVDGIDHFMLELSRREHLIDAEIEAIKSEELRLKVRRKAVQSLKGYFNNTLIPMVVEELGDENGVYETDTARYKLYETWGPVVIMNEDEIPDDFKKVVMTDAIDKKKAREVLVQGAEIPGFSISKVKRIRRSQ